MFYKINDKITVKNITSIFIIGIIIGALSTNVYTILSCLGITTIFFLVIACNNKLEYILIFIAIISGIFKILNITKIMPLILFSLLIIYILSRLNWHESKKIIKENVILFICMAIYMCISFLGILNYNLNDKVIGLQGYYSSILFMVCIFFGICIENYEKYEKFLFITCMLVAINGIRQSIYIFQFETNYVFSQTRYGLGYGGYAWHGIIRPFSVFVSPTIYAITLVSGCLINIKLIITNKYKILYVTLIIFILGIVLSMSRASWLGLIMGGLWLLIKAPIRIRKNYLMLLIGLWIVLITIYSQLSYINNGDIILDRIDTILDVGSGSDSALNSRIKTWEKVFNIVKKKPFGLGTGIATGSAAQKEYMGIGWIDNNYLKILIENGYIGLVSFSACIIIMLKKILKHSNREFLGIEGFFIAICTIMITTQILDAFPINMIFWTNVGILLRGYYTSNNENSYVQDDKLKML